jgi:CheY-like chemotaxis protein
MAPLLPVQHIALADDDEDDCVLFKDVLEELHISPLVSWAKNGEDLMQNLSKNHRPLPDIIFLDVNMPIKNGIECLKEIREDERLKHLPVIIFSTSTQQWAVEQAYELRANLFIRKPDTFQKLKDIIQRILSTDWRGASPVTMEEFLVR